MKGFIRSKLVQTLAALVMIAAAIFVPLSGNIKHSYADSGFSVVASPHPSDGDVLRSVTSISADNAWAVGDSNNPAFSALIEHWNGTSWTRQSYTPTEAVTSLSLFGVKALSSTNVWAVGTFMDANYVDHSLILHTTDGGDTWVEDTDSYQGGGSRQGLGDVLLAIDGDVSSGDAWAVGKDTSGSALTLHLVNGHFSQETNVSQNSDILLTSVSEHSSSDVWAVGSYSGGTYTMHYDGSGWTTYASPNLYSSGQNDLLGVTDIGPDDAWAVGASFSDTKDTGTLIHWNGSVWSTTPITVTVGSTNPLNAVAATSSNNIWAVGGYINSNSSLPLVWHSTDGGTSWVQVSAENPSSGSADNAFRGIAIDNTTGNIWAVGYYQQSNTEQTFIEQYTVSNPTPTPSPSPSPSPTPKSITVKPAQGSPGTVVTVTGSGWTPGDVIDLSLSPSLTILTKVTVAGDGTFTTSFAVPENATMGPQFVDAKDETTGETAQAAFTVTPRKLFVLLQGLSSELTPIELSQNQLRSFDQSNGIVAYLRSEKGGFGSADFLEYSYPVDFPKGTPLGVQNTILESPHIYSCSDTFDHSLNQDVRTLDLQIRFYLNQPGHQNTDVYLVGDSLGGGHRVWIPSTLEN